MSRIIPAAWLPDCKMDKIVVHWTGGASSVSALDRAHYHLIVDQQPKLHKGLISIANNARPMKKIYAMHARNFNAGAIGVSLTGMAGARESPFHGGKWPITFEQWVYAAHVVAELCLAYDINPLTYNVVQHGEIQKRHGVAQKGKWDVCKLPWAPTLSSDEACAEFRRVADKHYRLLGGGK